MSTTLVSDIATIHDTNRDREVLGELVSMMGAT